MPYMTWVILLIMLMYYEIADTKTYNEDGSFSLILR
jgi:hypothetical protein